MPLDLPNDALEGQRSSDFGPVDEKPCEGREGETWKEVNWEKALGGMKPRRVTDPGQRVNRLVWFWVCLRKWDKPLKAGVVTDRFISQ